MSKKVDDLKTCLDECILEIVSQRDNYSLIPGAFSRSRKWTLDKLIHFMLSLGSQSLGTEIFEYFHFQEGFPTVSAFVQQQQKLSAVAMEDLFRLFGSRI